MKRLILIVLTLCFAGAIFTGCRGHRHSGGHHGHGGHSHGGGHRSHH